MRILAALIGGLTLMLAAPAGAQAYPDLARPFRIIAPGNPGGSMDMLARALGRSMSEVSGLKVVVENKPGAELVIGVMAAKAAAPDGYAMLITSSSTQALNPHLLPNLPYDPVSDFVPLAGIAKTSLVLAAGPSTAFKTGREFIEAARANPGKYTYGTSTTTTRLAGAMLEQTAGLDLLGVPYKASPDSVTALASGQIDLVLIDALTLGPHLQSGRVRALAVTSASRTSAMPALPTLQEEGVTGYELSAWFATYLPARTPAAIEVTLRDIVRKAARKPAVTDILKTFALDPMDLDGTELAALQREHAARLGKAVRDANMSPK